MNNVILDGRPIYNWTTCLTQNFVPYFQKSVFSGEKRLGNLQSFR